MKRRNFTKKLAKAGGLVAASTILPYSCKQDNSPKARDKKNFPTKIDPPVKPKQEKKLPQNWLWIKGPHYEWSQEKWKQTLKWVKEIGFDAIIPEVYNSTFALFEHPLVETKAHFLEELIPLAHNEGLEVHAWMWSMILNNKKLVKEHPDWFSVNRKGEYAHTHPAYVDYYKFMCPCHPEVRNFVKSNVEALANVEGLDGIHLDYIRQPDVILAEALQPNYNIKQDKEYPEYDYPYSPFCREQFMGQTQIDPMNFGDDAPFHQQWRQFRYDAVTQLVNDFCVPAAKAKNKAITAAVFPNWESVRQQWHNWDLDGFLMMLYNGFYNKPVRWIGGQTQKNKNLLKTKKPVYSGLFMDHVADELKQAVDFAYEGGANGIALFSLNEITEKFRPFLKEVMNGHREKISQ